MSSANRLDSRLALCACFVRDGVAVADIGTDHAYLPIWLIQNRSIKSAVASDINKKPLDRARVNIAESGLSEQIEVRLSNGLQDILPDEADDIIIAGMGGEVIASIIGNCKWVKNADKHLILQPMSKSEELIKFLLENNFEILQQKCTFASGKYYTVILCRYCGVAQEFGEVDFYRGKLDLSDENSVIFLQKQIKKLTMKSRSDENLLKIADKLTELLHTQN